MWALSRCHAVPRRDLWSLSLQCSMPWSPSASETSLAVSRSCCLGGQPRIEAGERKGVLWCGWGLGRSARAPSSVLPLGSRPQVPRRVWPTLAWLGCPWLECSSSLGEEVGVENGTARDCRAVNRYVLVTQRQLSGQKQPATSGLVGLRGTLPSGRNLLGGSWDLCSVPHVLADFGGCLLHMGCSAVTTTEIGVGVQVMPSSAYGSGFVGLGSRSSPWVPTAEMQRPTSEVGEGTLIWRRQPGLPPVGGTGLDCTVWSVSAQSPA